MPRPVNGYGVHQVQCGQELLKSRTSTSPDPAVSLLRRHVRHACPRSQGRGGMVMAVFSMITKM